MLFIREVMRLFLIKVLTDGTAADRRTATTATVIIISRSVKPALFLAVRDPVFIVRPPYC